jgi:hypothetical protein
MKHVLTHIFGKKLLVIGGIGLFFLWGCRKNTPSVTVKNNNNAPQQKPITVFVHGTLPPLADRLVRTYDIPLGLNLAEKIRSSLIMGKIPVYLTEADPEGFPLETFYVFGWSGDLNFAARKKAAFELYKALQGLSVRGPITLIGHSHGCNVILNLAAIAHEMNDKNFVVDRAILLAGPVQKATEVYIHSDVFKKIYSFYSHSDLIQILDPQGLYKENRDIKNISVFSAHLFSSHDKLVQIRVKKGTRGIFHIEFVLADFIKKLPKILNLIDKKNSSATPKMTTYTLDLKNIDS